MWTLQRQRAHLLRCLDSGFCVVLSQRFSFTSGVLSKPFKFGGNYAHCSRNSLLSLQRRKAHNQVREFHVRSGNDLQRLSDLSDTARPFALGDNISWKSLSFEEQEEVQMYYLKLLSHGLNSIDSVESTGVLETLTALSDTNIEWKELFPPLRKTILKNVEKNVRSLNMEDLCLLLEGYDKSIACLFLSVSFDFFFFFLLFFSSIRQTREAPIEMGEITRTYYECIKGNHHHSSSRTTHS
jgi:hypothetical protein